MKNSVTIPSWIVGVIVTLALTVGGLVSKYSAKVGEQIKINEAMAAVQVNDRKQDDIIARHDAILPLIQKDIGEVKDNVKLLIRRSQYDKT